MKLRLVLLATAALVALGAFAPSANAAYLKVTPSFDYVNMCRPAPDQFAWSYSFKAKIKRKKSPAPKRVTIKYSVTDSSTGAVLVSQKLTLKPRKFYKVGAHTTYTAGTPITLRATASFKSPTTGRTLKSKTVFPDVVPTVEQLDAAGFPVAPCPVG